MAKGTGDEEEQEEEVKNGREALKSWPLLKWPS